jgi:hypothetical protein
VFNGLNALILKENNCAYYVHCFAHQLQLVSVAVAQKHQHLSTLFNFLSTTQNIVGASCKKYDKLHDNHAKTKLDQIFLFLDDNHDTG